MNNTSNTSKKIIVSIIVLVILIIGLTLYWQFLGPNSAAKKQAAQVINSQQEEQEQKELITALHQFANGRHTIAGEVNLPTPCHILNQNVTVTSAAIPEHINIDYVTTSKDESLCAQVLTSTRYKIDFIASEQAVITATWNGKPADLNLIPVAAGESLDNFDVFIKG